VASFRMANYCLWPFGRTVVPKPNAGIASAVGNVIWFIVAGWWLALGHLLTAIGQFISIIGIPLGLANIKLVPVSLFPLGHQIVDADSLGAGRGQNSCASRRRSWARWIARTALLTSTLLLAHTFTE